jgi:predicted MFS family arabinose efflux permease
MGAVALFIGLGLGRFAYSPMIPALVQAGWFSPAAADYLGAVNLVGYLIGAAVTGQWLAHRRPGGWLRLALAATAISLGACALPWGFAWYFIWRLLAGIAAGVLMVLAVPSVLARVPAARRGVLGGVVFGGVGVGMIFSGEALPPLVRLGLPAAWLILAGVVLALSAAAWGYWSCLAAPAARSAPSGGRSHSAGWMVILLLGAAYAGNAAGFAPHSLFWVDYIARELHRGLATGGHFFLLFGIGVMLGPSLAGWLGDRWGARLCLALALAVEALAVALPLWGSAVWTLAASSLLVGAAGMGATTLTSARTIELATPAGRTRLWGAMTLTFSAAYAAAGAGYAAVYSRTGSYHPVFMLAAGVLALGAVLAALAG